jgi:hypothetical protein
MSMITLTGGRVNYATIHDTQFVEFNRPDFHIFAGFGGTGDFPRTLNNGLERGSPLMHRCARCSRVLPTCPIGSMSISSVYNRLKPFWAMPYNGPQK